MDEMKLQPRETIVTAYAESASGPGWANSPVWVIVRAEDHTLRQECIQPDEQTSEMRILYSVSQAAHIAMTREVRAMLARVHREPKRDTA
jgi:hypothetical protein